MNSQPANEHLVLAEWFCRECNQVWRGEECCEMCGSKEVNPYIEGRAQVGIYALCAYDKYMCEIIEGEGYSLPVSLKAFMDLQIVPVDIYTLNLNVKEDMQVFERTKSLYLQHSVECMDSTEIDNTPVCYAEWRDTEEVKAMFEYV